MNSFLQDVRYAARNLLKTPGFTLVAILTLALGIGANIAAFSIVDGVLLRPLPFPQPGRLVRVFDDLRSSNTKDVGMSVPQFWDYRDRAGIFQDISVIWSTPATLTGVDLPQRIEALATSGNYFTMLGVRPQIGRVFTQKDEVPGFINAVVLSDGFWRRQYGADPNVIGKSLRLDGDLYQIFGVMPAGFRHPGKTIETVEDVYVAAGYNAPPFPVPPLRSARMLPGAIARLKPGLSVTEAQARLETFDAALARDYPTDYPSTVGWAPRLVSVQRDLTGNARSELFVLFAAVGFVLLIACVNLANLLLARGSGRQREIAIRLALGAGRVRLIAQLLTESVLLAFVSGCVALLTVVWLKSALLKFAPPDLPRLNEVTISASVLFFAFLVSILTGIIFGLAPALQDTSPNQIASLREGSRGSGSSKRQMRVSSALVASEVALSLILLVGAGLFLRSFWQILQVRSGFNSHNVVTAQIWLSFPNDPSQNRYLTVPKRAAFMREVLRRVSALPGVEEASIGGGGSLPLARSRNQISFTIEGRPADSEHSPVAELAAVSPGHFRVLEIPILSGRNFTDSDDDKALPVAIVDQTLARQYWPNENPIGKRVKSGPIQSTNPWLNIIGVVGDVKTDSLELQEAPHIYLSDFQAPAYNSVIYLRTAGDPGTLADAIRPEVEAVDPNVPVYAVRTMEDVIARSMAERRFALQILGFFAGVALLLAAIGIYGVMAYTFSQRRHEIGIRMALGAQPRDILRMALSEGMTLVAVGLGSGLVGALILTRFLRSMLYAVSPNDPLTFVALPALLAAVALLACFVPARRATQVDPLVALRDG
ncbi:MAG TPA: ABC transporter permease [Candidatus Acidoferrum sp.]|nr:ABC transporter permease [Candidatus Acidoferrum sp.]